MSFIIRVECFVSVLLFLFLINPDKILAQQDSQFTQYMYNTMSFNPAYAGSRGVLSAVGIYRNQWIGLDGAPVTSSFAIHSPAGGNVGLGLSFDSDKIGPMSKNAVIGNFSYTINANNDFKIAFGIRGSAVLLNVDFTKLNIYDPGDSGFQNNVENEFSPNVGAGVYVNSEKGYLGLSIPNFLQTKHYENNTVSVKQEDMHYYLMGGYVFDLNYNLKFKPAFLLKAVIGAPIGADISANFLYNEVCTLGVAYRLNRSVSGMAGFQVSQGLFVGYGYDADASRLGNYNSGSHELFLRFELFKNFDKVLNPRFF